ncbi:MAG: hypothetical protein AB8G15_17045 [Saprospiraceae bacterium]
MKQLIIRDESIAGKLLNEIVVAVEEETMTTEALIRARVIQEVEKYNHAGSAYFQGLVQPSQTEQTLNGYKLKKERSIDAEQQCYIALDAFQKNGFFILVDDHQLENLNEEFLVMEDTKVSFIKLNPLVGG